MRWLWAAQALGRRQTSSIFSWSSLWEQSLQNQLSSWAYPHGHPSCSLALGSRTLPQGSSLRSLKLQGLAPVSILFAQVQLE